MTTKRDCIRIMTKRGRSAGKCLSAIINAEGGFMKKSNIIRVASDMSAQESDSIVVVIDLSSNSDGKHFLSFVDHLSY